LASSAAIFSSVRGRATASGAASWPIRQRLNAELHNLPLGIPSNVRQAIGG
jgi:hypothetical protein